MVKKQAVLEVVNKLKQGMRKEIKRNAVETALQLISNCADILYQTNIYYVDEELESALKDVAGKLKLPIQNITNEDTLLFFDGFGLNNRGLAQIYLDALCKIKKVIYVTYEDRRNSIPDIIKIIEKNRESKAVYIKRNFRQYLRQIEELNRIIVREQPRDFVFYSVPNDVVGTVVLNAYEGIQNRYLINLTDHAFWLGARCIDKCIEFRDYGASVSKKYRGIDKNQIVKLPFYPQIHSEREFLGYPFRIIEGQKVVFSGGALYKTLGGNNKYYKMVDYILSTYEDVIFWFAGNGDNTELEKILRKYPTRAFHTAERNDLFQVLQHSRFYLSTYPICGGLMYQYAAAAGRVPLTLRYDDLSDGFLLNQENLGIEFESLEELYTEVDRLLVDDEYFSNRADEMQSAVITPEVFNSNIKRIFLENNNEQLEIDYSDIQTEKLREEYLNRLQETDIDQTLAGKRTLVAGIKYTHSRTLKGCLNKIARKVIKKF